ncbi:MAG: RsmF rRNA methyltransferase first C-terminal domain-containing protein [Lactobacillus iners]|nr:RsmF rRNA methyltransferase first C-terminal domain-containing protein [Lactobacillus iners]MCT7876408.1 RsmF rRNA methyltransferase first C-terminal domain-containing protein [Lactobacillus iners]
MYKIPTEFIDKFTHLLGEKHASELMSAYQENPKKGFRLNPLKYDYTNVKYNLDHQIPYIDNGYYGEISGNDSEWIGGYVYSQDPSAMYPATIADIKPGEYVLDLCAAPGGKSTIIASKLKNEGVLVANEISSKRAKELRENLEKWGTSNVIITNESPERLVKKFKNFFDTIIVDAPCSGEGMFRKSDDAIKYWSQEYVLTCQARQQNILNCAVDMLKNNGKLVYSTCTYSPEEDEQIVSWLMKEKNLKIQTIPKSQGISDGHPEWTIEKFNDIQKTARFWIQDKIGEGQFAALLKKETAQCTDSNLDMITPPSKKIRSNIKNRIQVISKDEFKLINDILHQFNLPLYLSKQLDRAINKNNHIVIPALSDEKLKSLHIISNGIELGILKKNRFEPSHQLVYILAQVKQNNVYNITNESDFKKYLHGETLQVEHPITYGYVLVAFEHHIFSFGKIGKDSILKNYYPKGLRR